MALSASFADMTMDNNNMHMSHGAGMTWVFGVLAIWVLSIVAFWHVFKKAGRPGWAAIVPLYNVYVMLKIAGRPGWWFILYFIPVVNVITHIIVSIDVAKAFGKSTVFGVVGLFLFSLIGFMILGFGDAKYQGVPQH